MPPKREMECLILSTPACAGAAALRAALADGHGPVTGLELEGEDAREALFDALADRRSVDALAAFAPLCAPALALSLQRPVDRLALVCGGRPLREGNSPGLYRFLRRNLGLCAADVLCVDPAEADARMLRRVLPARRLGILRTGGPAGRAECEDSVKNAICHFLRRVDGAKSLAENAEMCIIYR